MLDLVYPTEPAPVIGPEDRASEMLPIVEQTGIVVGQAARSYCHGGARPLHPVVHLHIIDRMGRIYLQRRSMTKDLLPGYWDTAVGGHVSYGERIREALCREAGEELGFFDFNPIYVKSYVWESPREREVVNVYAAVGNFELKPDNSEVDEGRFWTMEEIAKSTGKGILTPNFESEFARLKDSLLALL